MVSLCYGVRYQFVLLRALQLWCHCVVVCVTIVVSLCYCVRYNIGVTVLLRALQQNYEIACVTTVASPCYFSCVVTVVSLCNCMS